MAEAGDYVYIGTCYNSTYYIYHNNVKTSLDAMKKEGKLDQNVDTSRAAADFVKVMFGTDTQLLIPVYDYCIPQAECSCGDQEDPCGLFRNVAFPIGEFFPPSTLEMPKDYAATRSYCACH